MGTTPHMVDGLDGSLVSVVDGTKNHHGYRQQIDEAQEMTEHAVEGRTCRGVDVRYVGQMSRALHTLVFSGVLCGVVVKRRQQQSWQEYRQQKP